MPYKDETASRLAARDRQRRRRARLRETAVVTRFPTRHDDPAGALATWARETLRVPPGHPLAGQPMALPEFALRFLREGWAAHESALSTGRKNSKSAVCAVLALGHLVGPLRDAWMARCACQHRQGKSGLSCAAMSPRSPKHPASRTSW